MMYIYIISSAFLIGHAVCANCDDLPAAMVSFDESRFTGSWNVVQQSEPWYLDARCHKRVFSGPMTSVDYQYQNPNKVHSMKGTLTFDGASGAGDYDLYFNFTDYKYHVIDTDYTNYAVIVYCTSLPDGDKEYIEVITKLEDISYGFYHVLVHSDPVVQSIGVDPDLLYSRLYGRCDFKRLTGKWEELKQMSSISGGGYPLSGLISIFTQGSRDALANMFSGFRRTN